jgi:spoIIIJ-associated protein
MSSKVLEIEEKTIDEAIEKACQEFGVPREKLNIEIIAGESSGFLGMFSKKARIKASLLNLNIDFSFEEKPPERPKMKVEHKAKEPRPKHEKEVKAEKEAVIEKPQRQPKPEVFDANPALAARAKELLEGILQRIPLECQITANDTPEKIILDIAGDNSALLIGKRGQNIDALQYILNKAIHKIDDGGKPILIDSGEYRKRREEFLVELAEKIREKVKKTMKPVSLSHMNAHDRRIIHMLLQKDEALVTQSRGEGKFRKIVILPARKPGNTRQPRGRSRNNSTD